MANYDAVKLDFRFFIDQVICLFIIKLYLVSTLTVSTLGWSTAYPEKRCHLLASIAAGVSE